MENVRVIPTSSGVHTKPEDAFENAIKTGRLSNNPVDPNYAGNYMFMGSTVDGTRDAFKHRGTREYIK